MMVAPLERGLSMVAKSSMSRLSRHEKALRVERLRHRLRRQWWRWGLTPILAVGLLSLAASAVQASDIDPTTRRAELRLQAAMALAAAAFLAGFWLEGYRTATDKLLRRVASELGVSLGDLTREHLAASADIVEKILLDSHWHAILVGWVAATAVVVAAVAGMPLSHIAVVVVIAVLYELYLLSRQHHALEILTATLTGELVEEAQELARHDSFTPTWPQRVAMWFGWRPSLSPQISPRKRRHGNSR